MEVKESCCHCATHCCTEAGLIWSYPSSSTSGDNGAGGGRGQLLFAWLLYFWWATVTEAIISIVVVVVVIICVAAKRAGLEEVCNSPETTEPMWYKARIWKQAILHHSSHP